MTDQRPQDAPFPGADEADVEVERIIPPEQAPIDEAAEGPTVNPETEDTATQEDDAPASEEEAAAQLGDFA